MRCRQKDTQHFHKHGNGELQQVSTQQGSKLIPVDEELLARMKAEAARGPSFEYKHNTGKCSSRGEHSYARGVFDKQDICESQCRAQYSENDGKE